MSPLQNVILVVPFGSAGTQIGRGREAVAALFLGGMLIRKQSIDAVAVAKVVVPSGNWLRIRTIRYWRR